MGLWHGASLNFVIWGLFHALCSFGYLSSRPLRDRVPKKLWIPIGWMVTLPIMMLRWILFRAASVGDALSMFSTFFLPGSWVHLGLRENN